MIAEVVKVKIIPEDFITAATCNNFYNLEWLFQQNDSELYQHTFTQNQLQSLLRVSCLGGSVEMTKFWIKLGGVDDAYHRNTLLSTLCSERKDNVEMLKLLLESGADANGMYCFAPLPSCISRGNFKMAKLLLESGSTATGEILAEVAMAKGGREGEEDLLLVAKMLIERGAKVVGNHKAFYHSIRSGNETLVKLLLDHGASVCFFSFYSLSLFYCFSLLTVV